MVCRTVLETFRAVFEDPNDLDAVLSVMNKLADDIEPSVRGELMEQVPHIAMFCQDYKMHLAFVVSGYLLPMVVKFLTDANNQVRKTSQAALLVLLEQGLVEKSDVQEQVCPVILKQTEPDSLDDYRTEAVALLSKMAPLIGKEMVEQLFLERFASLCMDPLFHVRKLCAANFGDFSSVVGSESTESILLPKFFYLCGDGVWGVRKACADVFMPVSCVCSSEVRHSELSPLFINLLRDQSRWVRMAAFQALGPFISTFADPTITALLHNDNGEIVITEPDVLAERLSTLEEERMAEKEAKAKLKPDIVISPNDEENVNKQEDPMELELDDLADQEKVEEDLSLEEKRAQHFQLSQTSKIEDEKTNNFNSFNYWREPILSLADLPVEDEPEEILMSGLAKDSSLSKSLEDLRLTDTELQGGDSSDDTGTMELFRPNSSSSPQQQDKNSFSTFDPKWDKWDNFNPNRNKNNNNNILNESGEFSQDPALPRGPPLTEQDIVPQLLIDHYVSMTYPSRAQTVDSEIARHCAFSLPAVALTLGRSNWPLIKETYEILSTDMQWKVRRTLASSIHELGVILGEKSSGSDLIPIFNGFLKDLDEVRQGLLKHLADFLKLLSPEDRKEYLPKLSEFLKMDNDRNWRFRLELADQLERLIPLFTPLEIEEHISPIAMVLVHDKVAAVRQSATHVIASIILHLGQSEQPELSLGLLDIVTQSLIKETLWVHRQTFACLCLNVFEVGAVDMSVFVDRVLSHLLDTAEDRVPNVRLAVARTLSTINQSTDYLSNLETNSNVERMKMVEMNLKNDSDVDVRAFYGGAAKVLTGYNADEEFQNQNGIIESDDDFGTIGSASAL